MAVAVLLKENIIGLKIVVLYASIEENLLSTEKWLNVSKDKLTSTSFE